MLRTNGHLAVASETAVIVWDGKTHTEYFIRRAKFQTDQTDIGFLVPTPTPPKLTAASDDALTALEESLRPRVITHLHPYYMPVSFIFPIWRFLGGTAANKLHLAPVSVLSEERVGGYDATVVKADDSTALALWLKKNGYACPPDAQAWLQSYIRKGWTITAFKVNLGDRDTNNLHLQPVCMAFHADQPFYPYSEPASMQTATQTSIGRLLRVFVVAKQRTVGNLDGNAIPWPGATKAAWRWNRRPEALAMAPGALSHGLSVPNSAIVPDAWTTAFEDDSSPRPGIADLIFSPAARQETLEPAPEIQNESRMTPIWVDPLIALWIMWKVVRRRRQKRQTAPADAQPGP